MLSEWNPVLLKELRPFLRQERMSSRLFWVVSVTSLGLVWCLAMRSFAPGTFPAVGHLAFIILGFIQWFLSVMAIVPSATSIALEREKHTFEGLLSSPLRPEVLVRGKLWFAVYVATLTQIAVVPVLAGAYLLGGVHLWRVPLYLMLLAVHNTFLASAGIYFSTLPHKPPRVAAGMLQASMSKAQLAQQKAMGLWALFVIPAVYGLIGVLSTPMAAAGGLPPAGATALELLERMKSLGGIFPAFALTVRDPVTFFGTSVSFWVPALLFNGLLAALYYRLAVSVIHGRAHDHGPGVRLLAAALTHAALLMLLGNLWPAAPLDAPVAVYAFGGFASAWFLVFMVPSLTMGEALPDDRKERWAGVWRAFLRPREALRHRTPTGPAWLLGIGAPALGYWAVLCSRAPGARPIQLAVEAGILFGTGVVGYGLLGLSASVRRRSGEVTTSWPGLVAVAMLVGLAFPWLAMAMISQNMVPAFAQGLVQALGAVAGLVNPFTAMANVADRALGDTPCPLLFDLGRLTGSMPVPPWTVTAAFHLGLGAWGAWRLRGDWAEPPAPKEEAPEARG